MSKIISEGQAVDLFYSIIDEDVKSDELEHKSIITGVRNFCKGKDYRDYKVILYLFKYADPQGKLQELEQYENTIVQFCEEDEPVRDEFGDPVSYYFEQIQKYFLTNTSEHEVCVLIFKSTTGTLYSAAVITGYGENYGDYYGGGL